MSALSDLFEGNFNQIGGDFTSPSAITEFEDAGLALGGAALAATGVGALADAGVFGALGGAAGAADVGVGALAGDLGAGAATDVGTTIASDLGATGAADLGATGAADLSALNAADAFSTATAADPLSVASDAPSFDLGSTGSNWFNTDPSIQSYAADTGTTTGTAGATATGTPGASTVTTATPGTTPGGGGIDPLSEVPYGGGGAASGTGASSAAGGGGGFTQNLSSVLSSPYTKLAVGAVPLALTLGMGEQQLPASAQQLQAQALQLQQQGLTNLAEAQSGQLNAGQTAQISAMTQNLQNQWIQTLKNQGVQDPTKDARWPQIQAAIDQQVTSATAELIQQNITNALSETGQASTALTQIAQMSMTADQNFTNNLINATKSLGLAAGGGIGKITIGG